MQPVIIRTATPEDVPAMVEMACADLGEAYSGQIVPNRMHLTETLSRLVPNTECLFLVAETDRPIGMIGAMKSVHLVSGEPGVAELCWYVDKEFRNGRGPGLGLLRQLQSWAKQQGALWLQMVAPTEAIATAYRALGFEQVEIAFQRRIT